MQLHLENPIFPKADIRILMTFVAGKNDELGLKADSHLSQISAILPLVRKADIMCKKFTPDELNKMDHKTKDDVIYQMQDRLDRLEHNYENLVDRSGWQISSALAAIRKNWMISQASFLFLMRQKRIMMEQPRNRLWKRSLIHPERYRESLRKKASVKKT